MIKTRTDRLGGQKKRRREIGKKPFSEKGLLESAGRPISNEQIPIRDGGDFCTNTKEGSGDKRNPQLTK